MFAEASGTSGYGASKLLFTKKKTKGGDTMRLKEGEKKKMEYLEVQKYNFDMWWGEQALDFSAPGLPEMFTKQAERAQRRKNQEKRRQNGDDGYGEPQWTVDWSQFGFGTFTSLEKSNNGVAKKQNNQGFFGGKQQLAS